MTWIRIFFAMIFLAVAMTIAAEYVQNDPSYWESVYAYAFPQNALIVAAILLIGRKS